MLQRPNDSLTIKQASEKRTAIQLVRLFKNVKTSTIEVICQRISKQKMTLVQIDREEKAIVIPPDNLDFFLGRMEMLLKQKRNTLEYDAETTRLLVEMLNRGPEFATALVKAERVPIKD
jgi:hypothetical protein